MRSMIHRVISLVRVVRARSAVFYDVLDLSAFAHRGTRACGPGKERRIS